MLPAAGTVPTYGLTTFGSAADAGDMNPEGSGFGFLLFAGDSYVISRLRKRDGEPDPFVFLDCPSNSDTTDTTTVYSARVVCLSDDLQGCFQVAERGVEGTIVEMPDNGYWSWLVDSPGDSGDDTTDKRDLVERYYSASNQNWKNRFDSDNGNYSASLGSPIKVSEDLSAPVYWQGISHCLIDDQEYGEGFGAFVEGNIDAEVLYGWSMVIAVQFLGDFEVKEANGFINVDGSTNLTYGISGLGNIDITKNNKGNPAYSSKKTFSLQGDTVSQMGAFMSLDPYMTVTYQMATLNTTTEEQFVTNAEASFSGHLSTQVMTDLGDVTAYYPSPSQDQIDADFAGRADKKISTGKGNVVFEAPGLGGIISLGTFIRFGMGIEFHMPFTGPEGEDKSVTRNADQSPSAGAVCYPSYSDSSSKRSLNQGQLDNLSLTEFEGHNSLQSRGISTIEVAAWGLVASGLVGLPFNFFGNVKNGPFSAEQQMMNDVNSLIGNDCVGCSGCFQGNGKKKGSCCGCTCMDCDYGYSDLSDCDECDPIPSGEWPSEDYYDLGFYKRTVESDGFDVANFSLPLKGETSNLTKRESGSASITRKDVTVCQEPPISLGGDGQYPAFPIAADWPWDGIQNGKWDSISRYWGNSSESCTSWSVAKRATADEVWVAPTITVPVGSMKRAQYQTEHVFEGQLIGDFFNSWLATGKTSQYASSKSSMAGKNISCNYIPSLFTLADAAFPWMANGGSVSFVQRLLYELGNQVNLDRLTIFMGRANLRKGIIFAGKSTSMTTFRSMDADAQLLSAKELGMVFNYMNEEEVWGKFCDTYEAIYSLLQEFNDFYDTNPTLFEYGNLDLPDLQEEWQNYINAALDQIVSNGRATFDSMKWNA
ncbi:hypothetical protein N7528_003222 [Penicillium herquei]|nr:hypothetical protein N7528_003222 [Penicillium herquei]